MSATNKPMATTSTKTHYCSHCGEPIYSGDWIWSENGDVQWLAFCTPEHYRKYSGVVI